ncbi:hypothetical protein LQW54_011671 [Pestalotiopsis sp. IQ-011]
MDPDCAICHAPAAQRCDCEAKGLEMAVRQAEGRMMNTIYNDIRTWVRSRAQDYILEYFRLLTDRRKATHASVESHIQQRAWSYYNAPPHPQELAQAQAALKRGIDEDWQASVQRYPEVLEYFYSLVDLSLPADDDAAVKDPPLSALNGVRKTNRRSMAVPPTAGSIYEPERPSPMVRGRTPDIGMGMGMGMGMGGRTTAPPMGAPFGFPPPGGRMSRRPGPPGGFGHPHAPNY